MWRGAGALAMLTPLKFLGAGAFANVFMCRHQGNGQLVALKCILKSLVLKKKKQRRQQLIAEKAALSCSPHPNLIRLFASFADAQHIYFAMELALGGELFALIEEKDTLPEPAVKYYAASVMLGLAHLHAHGFIYRDLKPENLLLDSAGHLKICDLGLAKQADRTFTVVGTPQYVAPELLRGEGATHASDWWALGVLIFEMATGDLPFTAPDGSDATLFVLIQRGIYTWDRPPRPERPRAVSGAEPVSITLKDIVSALLRLSVPLPDPKDMPETSNPAAKRTLRPALGALRLGAGPDGVAEIRKHLWFKGFNFESILNGSMPAPYVPNLRNGEDDSNFGPLDWRGDPVLTSPEYDVNTWEVLWDDH